MSKFELIDAYYNSLMVLMDNPAAESTKQCLRAYKKFTVDYPEYDVEVKLCAFTPSEMKEAKQVYEDN